AGSGLAPDQDGQIGGRHLGEDREDLPHLDALAHELVKALLAAQVDLDHALLGLEAHHGLPATDGGARLDPDLAHAQLATIRAVRGLQIAEHDPSLAGHDLEVGPADGLVLEHQVADHAAPHRDPFAL